MPKFSRTGDGFKKLMESLEDIDATKLKTGWLESARYDDGTPVAGIMYQNEVGNPSRSIPARPFMRPAISDNEGKWSSTTGRGFKAVVDGKKTADEVMNALGLQVVGDIKNAIVGGDHAALSPVTIALRKHRNDGKNIGGAFVGAVAAAIKEGKTGSGELGDQSFGNKDPLRDSGYAISSLTHEVI